MKTHNNQVGAKIFRFYFFVFLALLWAFLPSAFIYSAFIDSVSSEYQETYFASNNEYEQVRVQDSPTDYVNVYEAPCGKGYQIVNVRPAYTDYFGYGCEASEYTDYVPAIIPDVGSSTRGI